MQHFDDSEFPSEARDLRQTADRFEALLNAGENFYLDPGALDEVFDYYFVNAENDKARRLLQFAIDRFPHRAGFHAKLALLNLEQEQPQLALAAIEQAVDLEPAEMAHHLMQARVLLRLGKTELAADVMAHALDVSGRQPEALYQAGLLYLQADEMEQALPLLREALTPEHEEPLNELVLVLEHLGRLDEATTLCTEHLNRHAFSVLGWYNLGMVRFRAEDYAQALEAFDYALVIDEGFLSAYHGKALAHMAQQEFELGARVLLDALHLDPADAAILLSLAECFEEMQNPERARFYYCKVANYSPDVPEAYLGIGATLATQDRHYEAIHQYRRALRLDADYFDAWLGLAESEYCVGNQQSAFDALEKAIGLAPDDLELWTDWAERLQENGDTERALSLLQRGICQNPQEVDLVYRYAAIALENRRLAEGLQYLENGLIMDFEAHRVLFEYNPQLSQAEPVQRLIEQYRPAEPAKA